MNLGELLSALVGGAGAGFQHQNAVATRGGDYLQKEELLARGGENAAIDQGEALRNAAIKAAAIKAAAMGAQADPTSAITSDVGTPDRVLTTPGSVDVPQGAPDELAAAVGQENTRARKEAGDLRAQDALTSQRAGELSPALEAKLAAALKGREMQVAGAKDVATTAAGARTESATTAADARKYAADHKAPPKPKEMFYRDASGNEVYGDPHGVAGAQRSLGMTSQNQLSAAKITENLGGEVSALIDVAEQAGEIGAIAGKKQFVLDEIGDMGPAAGELKAAIVNLAASHLRLTGTRGTAVQKRIEDLLTGTQTVESLRAKLAGIMRLSQASDKVLGSTKAPDAPAGAAKRLTFNPTTGELE